MYYLYGKNVAELLIPHMKTDCAIRAFYATLPKSYNWALSTNKSLPIDIWFKMVKGAKIEVAVNLYSRELTREQLSAALLDKRVNSIKSLIQYGFKNADEELVERVLGSKWFNNDYARLWLNRGDSLTPEQRKKLALKVGGRELTMELINKSSFPDIEEVISLINQKEHATYNLHKLFQCRSELVNHLDSFSGNKIKTALATSWYLIDEDVQKKLFGKNTLNGNVNIWSSLLLNPATKINIGEMIYDKASKSDKFSNIFRSAEIWKRAPGEPLTKSVEEVDNPMERLRAEYFYPYSTSILELPWVLSKYNKSQSSEKVSLDKLPAQLGNHYDRFVIDWESAANDIEHLMSDTDKEWSIFWGLLPEWNQSLLSCLEAAKNVTS